MELTEAREQLKRLQSRLSAYEHALCLISYDQETAAPKGVAANTAHAVEVLYEEQYRLSTCDETVRLLEELDARGSELTAEENREVFLLLKDLREMKKIPMEEYTAYQALLAEAYTIWLEAKQKNDFELFRPTLEKIFDTVRRFAGYCAPEKEPYDYWLDRYEDGLDRETCDRFFSILRARIVPLVERIKKAPQVDCACLRGSFTDGAQEKLARRLMGIMGIDTERCLLGTTEHPFTTSIGSHLDERITTRYLRDDFSSSMYSVIHEGGHALYDMGSAAEYAYTVLDGGVSMGIHESQSRFYENILGRSRGFTARVLPVLKELLSDGSPALAGASAEELYRAVNRVEPSLIRTEADEVTYCLHVMVRYEIEKKAMAGELAVKDFPAEWNRLYKEYLGVDVPDDRRGVLQDSHWSGGMIGYFPSYALGSAYGAQFLKKMSAEIDVDAGMAKGDFSAVNGWNRENIWQYGRLYKPGELLERVLGEPFDPNVYAAYLEKKYSEIYGL